jgi:PAS domain S-box-containing protein
MATSHKRRSGVDKSRHPSRDSSSPFAKKSERWPAAEGEAADLVRRTNWTRTPLGDIEDWPEALRVAVDLTLASPVAAIVLWGPENIQIYNDLWITLHSSKHPAAMGQPTHECFPELVEHLEPIYRRARLGEGVVFHDSLLPVMRGGRIQDAWWDVVYTPMRGESGEVEGIFCTLAETTEKVIGARALGENAEQKAFLLKLTDALRPLTDPIDVQKAAMTLLVEQFGVMRATYFEVEPDQNSFRLTTRNERDAVPIPERMRLSDFAPEMAAAYRAGRTLIFKDTEKETQLGSRPEAYRPIGVRSWVGVPLVKEGMLLAIVGVHSSTPRNWTATELQILEGVAERTWAAVERARSEAALRESEANMGATLQSLGDALIATHADGRVRYLNPVAESMTDWPRSEATGKAIEEVYEVTTLSGQEVAECNIRRVLERGEAIPRQRFMLRSRGGGATPVEETSAPVLDGDRVIGAVSIFADVSEQMVMEQLFAAEHGLLEERVRTTAQELGHTRAELQQLSGHLMLAYEEERRRLASELHDDLGQQTAVVEFTVKRLRDAIGPGADGTSALLELLSSQINHLAEKLRTTSHRLHPSMIGNLGLPTALRTLVEEQRLQNAEVSFIEHGILPPLPAATTTALYRIAQESLRNAAKHAKGSPIRVVLSCEAGVVELRVEDAGPGFDLKAVVGKEGLGLLTMQERARSVGATFTIDSAGGEGTSICVRVPIAKACVDGAQND